MGAGGGGRGGRRVWRQQRRCAKYEKFVSAAGPSLTCTMAQKRNNAGRLRRWAYCGVGIDEARLGRGVMRVRGLPEISAESCPPTVPRKGGHSVGSEGGAVSPYFANCEYSRTVTSATNPARHRTKLQALVYDILPFNHCRI